jgi:hypothetical protein
MERLAQGIFSMIPQEPVAGFLCGVPAAYKARNISSSRASRASVQALFLSWISSFLD